MNMANISETAKEYTTPTKTKNIADLKEVSVTQEIIDDSFELEDNVTKEKKVINQKVIMVAEDKYRVPASVIQQLKVILNDNPEVKKFKVMKSGTTKDDTRYQVIPLAD